MDVTHETGRISDGKQGGTAVHKRTHVVRSIYKRVGQNRSRVGGLRGEGGFREGGRTDTWFRPGRVRMNRLSNTRWKTQGGTNRPSGLNLNLKSEPCTHVIRKNEMKGSSGSASSRAWVTDRSGPVCIAPPIECEGGERENECMAHLLRAHK